MSQQQREKAENLRALLEQHWLHARHVENERLWFTNIFGIVVAGLLAVIFTAEDPQLSKQFAIYIGFLILALSLIGYFLCKSWRAPFIEHTSLAKKMLEEYPSFEKYTSYGKGYEKLKFLVISAHELFLYFYALMAGGALFLLLYVGVGKGDEKSPYLWISIVVSIILFSVLCASWRGYLVKREKEYV